MSNNKFSKISSIIQDAKKGKMFILVDDKNRENEGDLIIPGSKCNSKNINFMAKHGRGLICLALTKKQIDNLKLPLMYSLRPAEYGSLGGKYRQYPPAAGSEHVSDQRVGFARADARPEVWECGCRVAGSSAYG